MHENSDVSEEEDRYLLVAPSESLPPPVHLINVLPPLLPQSSSCVSCWTHFHPSRHPVDQPLLRCLSPLPFAFIKCFYQTGLSESALRRSENNKYRLKKSKGKR